MSVGNEYLRSEHESIIRKLYVQIEGAQDFDYDSEEDKISGKIYINGYPYDIFYLGKDLTTPHLLQNAINVDLASIKLITMMDAGKIKTFLPFQFKHSDINEFRIYVPGLNKKNTISFELNSVYNFEDHIYDFTLGTLSIKKIDHKIRKIADEVGIRPIGTRIPAGYDGTRGLPPMAAMSFSQTRGMSTEEATADTQVSEEPMIEETIQMPFFKIE